MSEGYTSETWKTWSENEKHWRLQGISRRRAGQARESVPHARALPGWDEEDARIRAARKAPRRARALRDRVRRRPLPAPR